MEDKMQDRLVIQSKSVGPKWEQAFFVEIQEAILKGYRFATSNTRKDISMRNFRGRIGRAVLYLEGKEPKPNEVVDFIDEKIEEITSNIEKEEKVTIEVNEDLTITETPAIDQLQDLTTKKELEEFAEKFDLKIPAKTTNPNAIKKHLKGLLESK